VYHFTDEMHHITDEMHHIYLICGTFFSDHGFLEKFHFEILLGILSKICTNTLNSSGTCVLSYKKNAPNLFFWRQVSETCVGGANVGETTIQHRFMYLNHKIALTF
jgi:hypothetical protein